MAQTFDTDMQEKTTSQGRREAVSQFVWYELHTQDAAAATAFYGAVLGWTTRDAGVPNRKYTLVCVDPQGAMFGMVGPGRN